MANIILHSSKVLNVEVDPQGALEMARRSRGTPRLANRILKRVRDFAQVKYDGRITKEVASFALDLLEVDRAVRLDSIPWQHRLEKMPVPSRMSTSRS